MAKKYDTSNYELSEYEKEMQKHIGNDSIAFDVFQNKVIELKEEKALVIYVYDFYDSETMQFTFAQEEGFDTTEEYLEKYYKETLKFEPDYFENEKETIENHKKIIEHFSQKFDLFSPTYSDEETDEALTTALVGAVIKVPLGEGLLDFCYAPFEEAFKNVADFYYTFSEEIINELRAERNLPPKETVIELKNRNQEIIETHMRYTDAVSVLGDVINTSLYSLINPPRLINQNNKAFTRYKNYIMDLQNEILSLIEFCYDEDFYPKLFSKYTPAQRFSVYAGTNDKSSIFVRKEIYGLQHRTKDVFLPTIEEVDLDFQDVNTLDEESVTSFAEQFDIPLPLAQGLVAFPNSSNVHYECCTIYDMLMLEFTKMLEHNVRFRKCKNCGQYFIMKGNYQTDFCDRIPKGETKSCQTIGSLKNYREKVKTSAAWNLYNKYYKRYFARMKAGNIDVDVFKKWQYKATAMRDECNNGKISEQEFEDFLYGSFVNKKR